VDAFGLFAIQSPDPRTGVIERRCAIAGCSNFEGVVTEKTRLHSPPPQTFGRPIPKSERGACFVA
jgi:hypothetical protein